MTLTSHASTLELSIIPSLLLYFKSFSDEHGGFYMLVGLYSEVQGCSTTRPLPRGAGASENPTGIWDSHSDSKSCSTLSSIQSTTTHGDTPVVSAWPWSYRESSKQAPAPQQRGIMAMQGNATCGLHRRDNRIPKSENLIHLIRQNFVLAIKFTLINPEGRYTCM